MVKSALEMMREHDANVAVTSALTGLPADGVRRLLEARHLLLAAAGHVGTILQTGDVSYAGSAGWRALDALGLLRAVSPTAVRRTGRGYSLRVAERVAERSVARVVVQAWRAWRVERDGMEER